MTAVQDVTYDVVQRKPMGFEHGAVLDEVVETLAERLRIALKDDIRQAVLTEADHVLKDVEWRFKQALEREQTAINPAFQRQITAEDLNTSQHVLTGYTVTNNSPSGGSIAWAGLHIVYNGTDYTITDANTALKYSYWQLATPTVLASSNTKPTLTKDDIMVFYNNTGTAVVAASDGNGSLPSVIANNSVDNAALNGAVVGSGNLQANSVTAGNGALAAGSIAASTLFTAGVVNGAAILGGAVTAPKLSTLQHILY